MEKCWTCRRRRLKCDGTRPHCTRCQVSGFECLGYGKTKPLCWVNGIASRGRWQHSSFKEADPSPLAHKKYSRAGTFITTIAPCPQLKKSPTISSSSSDTDISDETSSLTRACVRPSLTEPIFQDLNYDSRFLMDYYNRRLCPALTVNDDLRNPYREIMTRVASSPAITKAIIALSACHFSHGVSGMALFSEAPPRHLDDLSSSVAAQHYIRLKNIALRGLYKDLANPEECTYTDAFLTSFLLALLDIVESGANTWSVHIEGAKKLLGTNRCREPSDSDGTLERFANELAVLDTIGSTISRPNVLHTAPDLNFGPQELSEARGLTFIGCPAVIISALQFMTRQRWARYSPDATYPTAPELIALKANLRHIRDFDATTWANAIAGADNEDTSKELHHLLLHTSNVWKLAADMYATRVYCGITGDANVVMPPVDELIAEFAFLNLHNTAEKCLIWPTFIAGAECSIEQRDWVMSTLDKIWEITLSGNCRSAARVLTGIWEKQDLSKKTYGIEELDGWDWVMDISLQDDQWSFY